MRKIMKLFKVFSIFIVITCLRNINVRAEENFFGIYIGEDISNSEPVLCQNDVETALPEVIENALGEKEYRVCIKFNEKGKRILEDVTSENIGECMVVVYDGEIICKPYISGVCADGEAVISGLESYEEAEHLALILRTSAGGRSKNSDESNNAVLAYQGIFMNGDMFISMPLYTSYEPEDVIGIVYHVTKPVWDENGYIESDIIETLGEIYDLGSGEYEIRGEGIKSGLSYYDGEIVLTGDSGYDGTYVQVSNSGANMTLSELWLSIEENDTDGKENVEIEHGDNTSVKSGDMYGERGNTDTIHGTYTYNIEVPPPSWDTLSGKLSWEAEFLKDGMCEIDFCYGDYEYANDSSSYFESKFHYQVPYIIEKDEGVIYLDNSFNTDVEGSIAAEFNKCLLDDVEIIKD